MDRVHMVRPDAKGRIPLGHLADRISSFIVRQESHRIILEPNVEIPAREKWLYENKAALTQVKQGLKDAAEGKLSSHGSFSKYVNKDKKNEI